MLATWLALGVLFWQALLTGAPQQTMAPAQFAEAGIAICTEHGMQTLPAGDTVPGHPTDHSSPSCPCCLSFAGQGATILANSATFILPDWVRTPPAPLALVASTSRDTQSGPHQPRAPPLSI